MKLSQATREQKLKAAAELDGFKYVKVVGEPEPKHWQLSKAHDKDGTLSAGTPWAVSYIVRDAPDDSDGVVDLRLVPKYDTDYNAMISLIQKQNGEILYKMTELFWCKNSWSLGIRYKPSQLLDFLLIATGKMTI